MNWLIDSGHSGYDPIMGYLTAPAKMFTFPDGGLVIYEGVINREIARKLSTLLTSAKIDWQSIHDDIIDTPLATRVKRVNNAYTKRKDSILLSIHSNSGKGKGNEVFTSKGKTVSDPIAEVFCEQYKLHFPEWPFRPDPSDGDLDKEADFYVLKNSNCPAVLVESFFFDEIKQAELLLSEKGQVKIAMCLYEAIKIIELTK